MINTTKTASERSFRLTMNIRSAIYIATGLIVCVQTGKAEIMRVHNATGCSTTASTCGGESDWSDACCYLQDVLRDDPNVRCSGGDQIWVGQGVYRPDEGTDPTPGDRSATFRLPDACEVYGGYAGIDATDPDDRDPATYETILSGDLDDDDVSVSGPDLTKNTENAYHVVTIDDVNITSGETILDGFVIERGNANFGFQLDRYGAGVLIRGCSPDIVNCLIHWNWGQFGSGMAVIGQGTDRGQVMLISSDVDFPMKLTENWVGTAGMAIFAAGCGTVVTLQGTNRDPPDEVIPVEIRENRACGIPCGGLFNIAAGAIYANSSSCIVVKHEINVDNCAQGSGAGYYSGGGKFNIEAVTYFEIDNNMTNFSSDCGSGSIEQNIAAVVGCGCPSCP